MFYVTSLDGSQVEPLTNIGTDFRMNQKLDGTLAVSFSTYPDNNNPGYNVLKSQTVVNVDGYDFKVVGYRSMETHKSVEGVSTFFNLAKVRKEAIYGGTRTLREFLTFIFENTGWTFTVDPLVANDSKLIIDFGEDNIISLVETLKSHYGCEYVILRNNVVHFSKQVGDDVDYQYRYKHNVSDVVLIEDSANLFTVIKGTGANGITATYTSPNASFYGLMEADPIVKEDLETVEALVEHLKSILTDDVELAIESQSPEMTVRSIGERVWFIYEPIGVDMQVRIVSDTKSIENGELYTSSVIFGNVVPKTIGDVITSQSVQIDKNNKEYRSRFEQTDEMILLGVERIDKSIATMTIKADEINTRVTNVENGFESAITQTAASIRSEVTASITTVTNNIGDLTNAFDFTVGKLDAKDADLTTKTEELASSITQTAAGIRSEVTATITTVNNKIDKNKTDLDAALLTTKNSVSAVDQKADSISATVTTHTTSLNSAASRLSSAESNISQQATSISQRVTYTDYTGANITSRINQDPYAVQIQASKISLVGAVTVLSSISGNLGTITAGTINISTDATIGNQLTLGSQGSAAGKGLRFSNGAVIAGAGLAGIKMSANYIEIGDGTVDFTSASGVVWGSHAPRATFG